MALNQQRSLHYGLVAAAFVCSLVSLFGLVAMNAPRWTTWLNILAVISVLLAAKTRGQSLSGRGHNEKSSAATE